MSDEKLWPCPHITRTDDGWRMEKPEAYYLITNAWSICPIDGCGARRPKKTILKLHKILQEKLGAVTIGDFYEMALVVFSIFEEKIDEIIHDEQMIFVNKTHFKRLLREEWL